MIRVNTRRCSIVYGTRPEAIKLAPVAKALRQAKGWKVDTINTGQHKSLMPQIMLLFGVPVSREFTVMRPGQHLSDLTARTIQAVSALLKSLNPDCVLVQGDTATAFATALAAAFLQIPVGHVEAGLRTNEQWSPFPEEVLRRMVSTLATWHFCPSEDSADNLRRECSTGRVYVTGNPVVDALQTVAPLAPVIRKNPDKKRILATIHRRENFPMLADIFAACRTIAAWADVEFYFIVHANPVIREATAQHLDTPYIRLTEPMDYLQWIGWMRSADLILSDSGGIQEEASLLGTPLLVVRNHTERPEVISGHYAYLVGTERNALEHYARRVLDGNLIFEKGTPYGRGDASHQIAQILEKESNPR